MSDLQPEIGNILWRLPGTCVFGVLAYLEGEKVFRSIRAPGVRLLLGFVCALSGLAQTAQISGFVSDPAGAKVEAARVELLNEKTQASVTTSTNGDGLYTLSSLQPGSYSLRISAAGFETEVIRDIGINVGDKIDKDVALKLGSRTDELQVNGSVETINTIDATVSTVVDRRFVENLPLNGRSFQSLMTLAPGVEVVPSAGSGSSGELSVNGQRTEANYYTIDGISANTGATVSTAGYPGAGFSGSTPEGSALGTTQSIVSIDALEEFRATTSTYSAEYGRTPGGQFSFSTRSGTNEWHGSAFDYLRNDALDARNVFDTTKLPERQNDFGGTLGGPLLLGRLYNGRNKTFFFLSYEGLRLRSPVAATLYQVPSNQLRSIAPAALQPFLNAFPVSSGPDLGNGLADYIAGYSAPSQLDTVSVRVDHSFSDRMRAFLRFSDVPSQSSSRQPSDLAQVDATTRNVKTGVLGATNSISASLVNEFRLGLTENYYDSNRYLDNFGGATPLNVSTAPGLSNGDWMTFFLFYGLYPYYLLEPQSNTQYQWNVTESLTHVIGRHNLKYGIDYRLLRTTETLPPLWEVAFYYDEAAVLANTPAGLYVYRQSVNMDAISPQFGAYVQDDWKVSSRLNISAGLRWDLNPPPHDGKGNNPYTLNEITDLASAQAAPVNTPLYATRYTNFAPRLGIAYQLRQTSGSETVVRAGAGIFYDTGLALSAEGYYGIGTTGFASYNSAFPATLAQVEATPAPSAAAPYNAPIYAFDPHLKTPYTEEWNFAIEQALGTQQSLTLNYVGSGGRDLLSQRFYHPEDLGNTAFRNGDGVYLTTNGADSSYNALQAKFNRRLANGLQILADYTWSHAIDDASSNFTVFELRRSDSDYDIRNNFQLAASYDIPGHYQNAIASHVLSHWSLDTRVSARSALPVDVLQAETVDPSSGATVTYNPNLVYGEPLYVYGSQYPGGRAINYAAFAPTTVPGVDGSAGRNIARGFDAVQADVTLRRNFQLTEKVGLEFRAEAYNVLNHPIYGSIYNSLSDGAALFGQAYNTQNNQLGGLSALYQVGGPRSMQVSLKLHF